jgi:CrcB protein
LQFACALIPELRLWRMTRRTPGHNIMQILYASVAIGAAGFVGAILRFMVAAAVGAIAPRGFPYGTLVVNLTGCFLIALFLTLLRDRATNDTLRLALAVGFVGSYTTFSTFIVEINDLLRAQQQMRAGAYVILSLVLGIGLLKLGAAAAHWLERA